jgi:hypothetical protein
VLIVDLPALVDEEARQRFVEILDRDLGLSGLLAAAHEKPL